MPFRRNPIKAYSKAFIDQTLELYRHSPIENHDEKVTALADHTKVDRDVIERWIRNAENFVGPELPNDLADRFDVLIDEITIDIYRGIKDGSPIKDRAIALGILFDKSRVLRDQSTKNVNKHILYERRGLTTIPQHPAPRAIEDNIRVEPLQRSELREAVGQD